MRGGWNFQENQTSNKMAFSITKFAPIYLFISKKTNKLKYSFHQIVYKTMGRRRIVVQLESNECT